MKNEGKFLVFILAPFLVLTLLSAMAFAVPQTINYQGYLKGPGGAPVNATVSMAFSIYNAPTGDIRLWTETQDVAVTDGVFSVALGSVTPIALPFDEQYYLGVTVGEEIEMTPRAVLVSVPYAMRAAGVDVPLELSGATSADIINGVNTGTGRAGYFQISNPASGVAAVKIDTDGGGSAIYARTVGTGKAGYFRINNASNTSSALYAATDGPGYAAEFSGGAGVLVTGNMNVTGNITGDGTGLTGVPVGVHEHSGFDIKSDYIADVHIASTIARDSEIMPTVLAGDGAGSTLDADKLDGQEAAAFAQSGHTHAGLDTVGGMDLSQLVALLDGRYGNIGDSLVADFSATPMEIIGENPVNFTDLSQGVAQSWLWDFGDTGTSTLQNPSHTYTAEGTYTVSLTVSDGVTSNTTTKTDYITVYLTPPIGTITTVASAGNVGQYTSIAIGADGLPVISYYNATSADLMVAHCGDAFCSTGNAINMVDSAGDVGQYSSIAIGVDGLPVISYYYNATNYDLKVAHCGDASCSSGNTVTTVDSSGNVGQYTSIAIGEDGKPIIAYYDDTNFDLKVAHCGNADCSTGNTLTTIASSGTVGMYPSIAIGVDGLPVISYFDFMNGSVTVAHCGVADCSSLDDVSIVEAGGIFQIGAFTSIAIGADDLPVISYYDIFDGNLRFAHCGDVACSSGDAIRGVDAVGDVGGYTSIAAGADGMPVISYLDYTNNNLKVAHCGDISCSSGLTKTITAVDSAGDVGGYTSIAIGDDGKPIISYYDITNGDLKVAHCGEATCSLWP